MTKSKRVRTLVISEGLAKAKGAEEDATFWWLGAISAKVALVVSTSTATF